MWVMGTECEEKGSGEREEEEEGEEEEKEEEGDEEEEQGEEQREEGYSFSNWFEFCFLCLYAV